MFAAKVVSDSISHQGVKPIRLVSFKLRYPRMIHAELMTHRMLSRNASGSRAVPISKMIEEAESDDLRAEPIYWGANERGMQASKELTGGALAGAKRLWRSAARDAAAYARAMQEVGETGVHKQITNRILEPFVHINTIYSATEWENFFGLRLDKAAMPEVQHLANLMWVAREESVPKVLQPGEWALPFVEGEDRDAAHNLARGSVNPHAGDSLANIMNHILIQVSIARCARVSFESFETGKRTTVAEDMALYRTRLHLPPPDAPSDFVPEEPIHASPAEHQATPDTCELGYETEESFTPASIWDHPELHGNFEGFIQYRKTLPGERVAPLPEKYRSKGASCAVS